MPYQCWQCGRRVDQVVRTSAVTGWSFGRSGPRAYSHRVNLCVDCVRARRRRRWMLALGVPVVLVLVVVVQVIVKLA
jgi:hypothetical protein